MPFFLGCCLRFKEAFSPKFLAWTYIRIRISGTYLYESSWLVCVLGLKLVLRATWVNRVFDGWSVRIAEKFVLEGYIYPWSSWISLWKRVENVLTEILQLKWLSATYFFIQILFDYVSWNIVFVSKNIYSTDRSFFYEKNVTKHGLTDITISLLHATKT